MAIIGTRFCLLGPHSGHLGLHMDHFGPGFVRNTPRTVLTGVNGHERVIAARPSRSVQYRPLIPASLAPCPCRMMGMAVRCCKRYGYACLCVLLLKLHYCVVASKAFAFVSPTGSRLGLTSRHIKIRKSFILSVTPSNNANKSKKMRSTRDRRASAAIEKGGGFFVPGLEGSRIRFLFGLTVLLAGAANHILSASQPDDLGQTVAELVSAFYGALLLLQGSLELGIEKGFTQTDGNDSFANSQNEDGFDVERASAVIDQVSVYLQGDQVAFKTIQQTAQTIITYTPATYFRFVDEEMGALYSSGFGNHDAVVIGMDEQKRLAKLALGAISSSEAGRVALPSEHPVAKLLPEAATRCILIQKVTSHACMVIGSDKLLPSFTKNDLRWIGQLAEYINLTCKEP